MKKTYTRLTVPMLTIALIPFSVNAATLETGCGVSVTASEINFTGHPLASPNFSRDNTGYPAAGQANAGGRLCFYNTLPATVDESETCDLSVTEQPGTNYVSLYGIATDSSCIWSYDIDVTNLGNDFRSNPQVAALPVTPPPTQQAQPVPIFSPIGFLVLLSGLFWFGNRRKTKS